MWGICTRGGEHCRDVTSAGEGIVVQHACGMHQPGQLTAGRVCFVVTHRRPDELQLLRSGAFELACAALQATELFGVMLQGAAGRAARVSGTPQVARHDVQPLDTCRGCTTAPAQTGVQRRDAVGLLGQLLRQGEPGACRRLVASWRRPVPGRSPGMDSQSPAAALRDCLLHLFVRSRRVMQRGVTVVEVRDDATQAIAPVVVEVG